MSAAEKGLALSYKPTHLMIAIAIMAMVFLLPPVVGLPVSAQRILGVLAFAVYVWVSEAMPYPVSAIAITFLMIMCLGTAPGHEGHLLGTAKAIPMAMSGFINSGWVLVAAGLFLAEAVRSVGLDRRIALRILRVVGTKPCAIIGGIVIANYLLAFIIPSIAARAAAVVPISMGLIKALNIDYKSAFARQLMVVTGIMSHITAIFVLTGGAPNPFTVSQLNTALGINITWMQWFIWFGPFAICLGILFFLLVVGLNKFEPLKGGKQLVEQLVHEMGPMSVDEKKIAWIFSLTIVLWCTENLHHIDANTVTVFAVLLLFMPYIGVATWKQLSSKVEWGTLILFGVGISIGEVLFKTGAAAWVAKTTLGGLGLEHMSPFGMVAAMAVPLVVMRMAFASDVAMAALVIPTLLGLFSSFHIPGLPIGGLTMVTSFCVYYSFILPVNTPAAMMAYATGTFELKDMFKVGIPLTVLGIALFLLFVKTYWHWVGLV
ncbi:SLC13 family permease [Paludibacterium yongneupense]|uniref:SLC13 family permease n=1 Tax=Paludibacterium yongneupense TaxID=400061 RepID=UPI00040B1699|nr:DASS family sodium-coupled anion symporter [Paludibacterium yongneupense]